MRKFFFVLVLAIGALAAISVVMKRRSSGSMDEWRSIADDATSQVRDAVSKTLDEAGAASSDAMDGASETSSEALNQAKDAASKISGKIADQAS